MVALKPVTLALLGLTATASAAPRHAGRATYYPPPMDYPGCGGGNSTSCPTDEFCYKPGPSDWPYGVCMPKGSTVADKRQDNPMQCAVGGSDCTSGLKCQPIGPIGSKTGICIPESATKRSDNLPPPMSYPGCGGGNSSSSCPSDEFCYKPGPADWPYGVCMPKGSTPSEKRAESNPPPLEYPGCGSDSTCKSAEFCYKPGPSDWPYGVCMPKGSTASEKRQEIPAPQQCAVGGSDCDSGMKCQAIGPIGSQTGLCIPA